MRRENYRSYAGFGKLVQDGDRLAQDTTSRIGEFFFDHVKPGRYDVTIAIDDLCVVVPDVEI